MAFGIVESTYVSGTVVSLFESFPKTSQIFLLLFVNGQSQEFARLGIVIRTVICNGNSQTTMCVSNGVGYTVMDYRMATLFQTRREN